MKKTLFVFFAVIVLITLTSACGPAEEPSCSEKVEIEYKRDLRALVDNNSISGVFFLGTGSISNQHSYIFVEKIEDGGFYTRKIRGSDAIVYEHNDIQKAWVVKKNTQSSRCIPENTVTQGFGHTRWYELHIPVGSIVSLTEIDLE